MSPFAVIGTCRGHIWPCNFCLQWGKKSVVFLKNLNLKQSYQIVWQDCLIVLNFLTCCPVFSSSHPEQICLGQIPTHSPLLIRRLVRRISDTIQKQSVFINIFTDSSMQPCRYLNLLKSSRNCFRVNQISALFPMGGQIHERLNLSAHSEPPYLYACQLAQVSAQSINSTFSDWNKEEFCLLRVTFNGDFQSTVQDRSDLINCSLGCNSGYIIIQFELVFFFFGRTNVIQVRFPKQGIDGLEVFIGNGRPCTPLQYFQGDCCMYFFFPLSLLLQVQDHLILSHFQFFYLNSLFFFFVFFYVADKEKNEKEYSKLR